MEALPRLPMLSFDLKHSPEYIEFGPTLKQYIKDHYGEDPAQYNKACTDLEQLRQAAIQVSRDFMGCTTLKKYYIQLEYLQKRFPMGDGGEAAIAFTWEDVQTGRDHVMSDIKFEQACILYNIGSLHSLLGVLDTRHNVEGMRVSCTHFQIAAWVFEYLRDNFSTSTMSTDMSYELLSFHIILMLAQAQECILEKSLVDNRKNNITSKVAAQVVELYKDASRLIDQADQKQQISSRMHKEWGRRLLMKAAFYQCVTYYFLGRRSQELEKPGECLAYYTAARDELATATQLAKNEVPEVLECLQFAKDVVLGKYESAKKDNDFVYHDKVPALESLPEVKGASLAKGIAVDLTDKEISGPDIFQKLVPMEAHEASSVYSEEKAKLSRVVVSEIEQKNMELEQFMSSLQLDMEQLMPKPDLIPEALMEKCAAMSVRTNAIKELTDSMASVSGLATEVQLSIEEIQQMIDEDNEKTEQFEKQYGKKNPSSVLPGLLEELTRYQKQHEEGSQLNATLHKAMSTHTNNLKTLVLTPSEIQAMLPPSQPSLSNEDQEVVSEIRRLLQKVNEMKEQRKALLEQFRDKIHKDDITNVLVTQEKTDKEVVFAEQLKKHDQLVGYIRQNLSSQDNILRHLTDTNAKYALIRQAYNEASARREKVVQDLILSYEKYEELLAKSEKGVEYYRMLLQNVAKTLERCRSECKVRQEERDMLTSKLAPKAPPPSRPTAPKPDLSSTGTPSSILETSIAADVPSGEEFSSLSMPAHQAPSAQFQNLPPKFEGPKLKDYLPFMKPRSFGPKASPAGTPQDTISLPTSVPSDTAQFDSGDFNISQRYPGLDPSLASVLPATLAQYLASVSSAGTSMAGGVRHSPSHSPSPPYSSAATPPRHCQSPLATPPNPAIMQGSQYAGYTHPVGPPTAVGHSNAVPAVTHTSQLPTSQAPQQSIPGTYIEQMPIQPSASMYAPAPYSTHALQYAHGTTVSAGPGVSHQQQPYEQFGYMSGVVHHQQYTSMPRHADTSTVSSASRPIFSPGQETKSQAPFNFQQHSMMQTLPQQQQYPQQFPQQAYIPPQEQPQQQHHHYQAGQMPLPSGQLYEMTGDTSSVKHSYEGPSLPLSSQSSQPFPPQTPPQHWSQNQFSGHGQMPSGYGQMPSGQVQMQDQTSKSETPSVTSTLPGQTYSTPGYGLQSQVNQLQISPQQYQPQQQTSLGPTHPVAQTGPSQVYGPYQQVGRFAGAVPQEVAVAGANIGGPTQLMGVPGGQPPQVVNQQMVGVNLHGGGAITALSDANQQGVTPYQTHSPYQSPSRTIQPSQGHEIPVTSVGYRYAKGQHQGPYIADYGYPSQQLYQYVDNTVYQPTQPYSGGYQHSINRSYQTAQIYGTFTSKANIYGQSGHPISTQSVSVSTQNVMSHGQGSSLQVQKNQQPAQPFHGSQIQGHVQGPKFQDPGQGPHLSTQIQGPYLQGQAQDPQMQGQYSQGNLPLLQPQQVPGQMTFPHLQQQLPGQGQLQQQLPAQQFQYSQQQQPQPGFHQQPGIVTPSQQPGFQSQPLPMMQQQQFVGPYNPQQQLPMHGPSNQAPAAVHSALSANIATMQPPLQPINMSGVVRPAAPGQVLSRPSTPGSQVSTNAPSTPTSPVDSKKSVSRQGSSLDDILSSSPNGVSDTIITPQVLTDQERQLQKEEALKNQAIVPTSEPYSNQGALHKLLSDVEAFGKFVDELSITILGVSRLDTVWKSLLDSQDAAVKKQSMAIARCYPMKNRDPDIMPYDDTRVVLTTTKDDYINASLLNDLAPSCPKFITTQAPMTLTMGEFWAMVYEQGSEVLVQITSEYETGKKYPVYYPVEKDKTMEQGAMLLSLQSVKFRQHWVERILHLKNVQTKQGRTIVHLQYKNWPVSGFPDEISSIVQFISEVHTFYMQQRSLTKPIIVQCGFGIGRTGVFSLVYAAMQEILHGSGLVDIPGLARRMLQKRKGILHKKEQLKYCYDAVLYFAEEYLQKRGILVKNPHFSVGKKQTTRVSPKHQSHSQSASDDIVLGTVDLQTIRENVGRLHVHTDAEKKDYVLGLTDQSLSKKSLESLSSISNSSLPDVVQQYSDSHSINELDRGSRSGSDPNIMGLQNQQIGFSESHPASSGPQSLSCSVDLNLGQTVLPQGPLSPTDSSTGKMINPDGPAVTDGGGTSSLAQLQDPATFTLGSPDSKKKSKITKANFHQSVGTLQTAKSDPGDPLGSLDPLWTLTKK